MVNLDKESPGNGISLEIKAVIEMQSAWSDGFTIYILYIGLKTQGALSEIISAHYNKHMATDSLMSGVGLAQGVAQGVDNAFQRGKPDKRREILHEMDLVRPTKQFSF